MNLIYFKNKTNVRNLNFTSRFYIEWEIFEQSDAELNVNYLIQARIYEYNTRYFTSI